jgi:LysR family transcriptional activator for leuABCD operon
MFNLRSLDLNLLTVFEAIYEIGTVSGAAERLNLSQSATSHALSRLRETCGDALFVRAVQGQSPTPVAKAMYPRIKQALEALRESLSDASGFDPARSQRDFRVSIPHPMGPFYVLSLRAAAAKAAPGVELSFEIPGRLVSRRTCARASSTSPSTGCQRRSIPWSTRSSSPTGWRLWSGAII